MSDSELEPGSLEFKMNTACLRMNQKLKENGYNERERAYMFGMTVGELRQFLTMIWEHLHNEKTVEHVGEELDPTTVNPDLIKIDGKVHRLPESGEAPKPKPPVKPVQTPSS